jgi:hypothetical protein
MGAVPMRVECKHYESRTYANGEIVRKCNLDLAPEAPWRCPDDCPRYERRLADAAWVYGSLVLDPTPPEPPGVGQGEGVGAVLDAAEDVVNSALPHALAEHRAQRARQSRQERGWRRWFRRGPRR